MGPFRGGEAVYVSSREDSPRRQDGRLPRPQGQDAEARGPALDTRLSVRFRRHGRRWNCSLADGCGALSVLARVGAPRM